MHRREKQSTECISNWSAHLHSNPTPTLAPRQSKTRMDKIHSRPLLSVPTLCQRTQCMKHVATDGFEIFLTFLMLDGSAANETKVFLFPMKSLLLSSRKRLSRVHVPTKWAWLKGIIIRDLFHKLSELAGCASISLLFLRSIRQYTPKKLFAGYCSLLPSKPTTKHNPWEV